MFTRVALTMVTAAEAVAAPAVTALAVASIVTAVALGRSAGAVYVAVVAPLGAMVPTVALPPAIPFTSHAIVAPLARQNEALKLCTAPRPTFAALGVIPLVVVHAMVTVALPVFVLSATLAAVTVTVAGAGGIAGAV
jgi:hypothetical protein